MAALLAVAGVASQGGKAKGAAKGAAKDLKLRQPGKVAARVQVCLSVRFTHITVS